jgi:hypothetical protein
MGRKVWLWRWRRNPLRRRSYIVEAWALLAVGLITAAAAAATGAAVSHQVRHRLVQRRLEWHPNTAVLTEDASTVNGYGSQVRAQVRWNVPGGSPRTGLTMVGTGLKRGARVTIWNDDHGQLVSAPPTAAAARLEAVVTGATAAGGVSAAVLICWAFSTRITDRHRSEQWATEWSVVGPRWDSRKA